MRDAWQKVALGDLFETINRRVGEHTEEPEVFSVTKYEGFVPALEYFGKRVASDKLNNYKIVGDGEWAYSTIHIDEGSIARNALGRRGVVSPMYTTMRLSSSLVLPYFCELVLRSPEMLAAYGDTQQGSINRRRSLPWKVFSQLEISLPPLHDQRRVVDLIESLDDAIEAATNDSAWNMYHHLLESWMRQAGSSLQSAVTRRNDSVEVQPQGRYRILGVLRSGKGLTESGVRRGEEIAYKRLQRVGPNQLVYRKLTAWEGPITVSPGDQTEGWVSNEFPVFDIDSNVLLPDLMRHMCRWPGLWHRIGQRLVGSVQRRKRLNPEQLVQIEIPLPDIDRQADVLSLLDDMYTVHRSRIGHAEQLRELRSNLLTVLLSGKHEIPESYDELMEQVLA